MRAAPPEKQPSRRNHSWQRQRLLELLRSTDSHPTTASLHRALRVDFPRLSLGTVYRNLEILVSQGEIEPVPASDGVVRYDGNPEPHHHFVCDRCGEIEDLELPLPRGLLARLRREHGLAPRRVRIDFYGLCLECSDPNSTYASRMSRSPSAYALHTPTITSRPRSRDRRGSPWRRISSPSASLTRRRE